MDEKLLDKIIPLSDEETEMEEIRDELEEEGFVITNFSKGGIFYTLIRLFVKIYLELIELARNMIESSLVSYATGDWLDIKAADYGKSRKEATKTKGYITIYRNMTDESLSISSGHMFQAADGKRYYATEDVMIPAGQEIGKVLVEAARTGSIYNLKSGTITNSMIYLPGAEKIINEEGWILEEGTDEETDEKLKERCLNSYAELAERTVEQKLKNVAESVNGVIAAEVVADHPRGQGTVDIYITGSAGSATPELIEKVTAAIEYLKGNYEDYLVKSAEVSPQDFDIVIYLAANASTEGVEDQAREILQNLFRMNRSELNRFYKDTLVKAFADNIQNYRTADIRTPESNVILEKNKVITLGTVNIQVKTIAFSVLCHS